MSGSRCPTRTTRTRSHAPRGRPCSARSSSGAWSTEPRHSASGCAPPSEQIASTAPLIEDVRGRGLLIGLELVSDRETNARFPEYVDPGAIVRRHGLDHGLLLYSRRQNAGLFGDWLLVAPPLVIAEPTIDGLVERLRGGLQRGDGRGSLVRRGPQEREPLRVVTAFSRSRLAPGQTFLRVVVGPERRDAVRERDPRQLRARVDVDVGLDGRGLVERAPRTNRMRALVYRLKTAI